jgi:hypothetical protein
MDSLERAAELIDRALDASRLRLPATHRWERTSRGGGSTCASLRDERDVASHCRLERRSRSATRALST